MNWTSKGDGKTLVLDGTVFSIVMDGKEFLVMWGDECITRTSHLPYAKTVAEEKAVMVAEFTKDIPPFKIEAGKRYFLPNGGVSLPARDMDDDGFYLFENVWYGEDGISLYGHETPITQEAPDKYYVGDWVELSNGMLGEVTEIKEGEAWPIIVGGGYTFSSDGGYRHPVTNLKIKRVISKPTYTW